MRPLLLGHRGARASRHIPENTLASFALCLEHGCDGFEFDVRRSADGVAVICHDPAIAGIEIRKTAVNGMALPTLEQVLQQFSSQAFLDIELKVTGLQTPLIAALGKHPPQKGFVVSSFLPDALRAVHALDRNIPLGLLCEKASQLSKENWTPPVAPESETATSFEFLVQWVIPRVDLVDRALIQGIHATAKKVMVWTANDPDAIQQLAEWGVDALISDDTERLARLLR